MITVTEARQIILESAQPLAGEHVPSESALYRSPIRDIKADRPIPPYNRVAMDGFAVRSSDFTSSSVTLKIIGKLAAGDAPYGKVRAGEAVRIMTGAPLAHGADAVVKVEHSQINDQEVTLTEPGMKAGLNIAFMGEDAEKGKVLLEAGTPLSPSAIAVCSSVGLGSIEVYKKPNIRILCTGNEIIDVEQEPLAHQIRDCNSFALRSLCDRLRLKTRFMGIAFDNIEILREMIREALSTNILLLTGGVSMGDFDFVPQILSEIGVDQYFHKVNLKPGKPLWFGKKGENTFVFGLPGNPVSVQVNFKLFVEPLIRKLAGESSPEPNFLLLPLDKTITKRNEREQYFPAKLINHAGKTYVTQTRIQGSGDFSNLAKSQGLIRCPKETGLLEAESLVEFLPWERI